MSEGDTIQLLQVGHQGWWFVRHVAKSSHDYVNIPNIAQAADQTDFVGLQEGWVPASYLESVGRPSSVNSSFSVKNKTCVE